MTRTVLLVEQHPAGHRLNYVGIVARAALARGHRVVVALPGSAGTSAEASLWLPGGSTVVPLPDDRATGTAIAALARQHDADRTFVLTGDDLIGPIARDGWRGCGELSLLVMRPRSQRTGRAASTAITAGKALLRAAARARGPRVRVLVSAVAARSGARTLRDPVRFATAESDVSAARRAAALDEGTRWAAVVGVIAARKHVPLVADAVAGAPGFGLLLAGLIEEDARAGVDAALERLRAAGRPVRVLDRLLDDVAFDEVIRAADVVVAAHANEGASGVLGKCAAAGTPIVVAGARSLRRDARRLPGLATWVPLDATALRRALLAAARPAEPGPAPATEQEFARTLLGPGR